MKVSKIKIIVETPDEFNPNLPPSTAEIHDVIPFEIAEFLLIELMEWKRKWMVTPEEHEEFLESKEKMK